MKKLLAIILTIMLAFTTVLVTACNNGEQTADTSEEFSSSEEPSSTRKKGSGAGSHTPSAGSAPSDSSDAPIDSSSTLPDVPSSSTPAHSFQYGSYNYEYSESPVMPQGDTNQPEILLDMLIYSFYLDYPKPTLSNSGFITALKDYEQMYNNLTVTQKAAVQNYAFLLEARRAYNEMAKAEAEKLISSLPDASIDNLTQFGLQANAIQTLLDNIGSEANSLSNKAEYDQKVAKADNLLINAFNEQVALLEQFEYSDKYKQNLDYADSIYNLMNASQQSRVSANYAKLTSFRQRYADAAVAYSFVETVESLPDINSLTDTDQAIIKQLKRTYNKMTDAEKAEIPAETKSKYDAYVAKANELWPEHVLYVCDNSRRGDDFFKFSSQFSSADRAEEPVIYEGKTQTNGIKFKSGCSITFTTNKAGVFTVYANVRTKEETPCDLILSFNGQVISQQAVKNDPTGENCEYVFDCNAAGTYTLSGNVTGDGAILYYLIFS